MKQKDLRTMFTDSSFKSFDGKARQVCNPNSIYFQETTKRAVIVAWMSQKGPDFSISENAVDYVDRAVKQGKVTQAYVVIAEGSQDGDDKPVYVDQDTLGLVMERLARVNSIEGGHGNYWWLNREMVVLEVTVKAKGYTKPPF